MLKSYISNEIVLKGISFDVREGEGFCILGANGAGKTTLIKIMYKLLNLSSGNVMFFNKNINKYFFMDSSWELVIITP